MDNSIKKHITFRLSIKFIISVLSLSVFIFSFSPKKDAPLLTLVPLLLSWFSLYYGMMLVFTIVLSKLKRVGQLISISFASLLTLLVMFSALGQLAFFDFVLFLALTVLAVFYIKRTCSN